MLGSNCHIRDICQVKGLNVPFYLKKQQYCKIYSRIPLKAMSCFHKGLQKIQIAQGPACLSAMQMQWYDCISKGSGSGILKVVS